MAYIYKITNTCNQKSYIGQTSRKDPFDRWREHISESQKKRSINEPLYSDMKTYGIPCFEFTIIEETNDGYEREKYYIELFDTYKNGYNRTHGGGGRSTFDIDDDTVCDTFTKKGTIRATAEELGCDAVSVRKVLKRNNIEYLSGCDRVRASLSKKVARTDPDTGEVLEIFDCMADADRKYNTSKHISAVCNGKRKTCCGYGWKHIEC